MAGIPSHGSTSQKNILFASVDRIGFGGGHTRNSVELFLIRLNVGAARQVDELRDGRTADQKSQCRVEITAGERK